MARWAITLGAAGTIVAATAMYGVLFGKEVVTSKHNLLLLAGILLAVAFMLVPVVRRGFNFDPVPSKLPKQRTLLDEMREGSQPETASEAAEPALATAAAVETAHPAGTRLPIARLIIAVYVVFAATLLTILWALQTN